MELEKNRRNRVHQKDNKARIFVWRLFLTFNLWLAAFGAFSQLVFVPTGPNLPKSTSNKNARVEAKTLKLPFFDDFSITKTAYPDTSLWQLGGGTYISNTATTDHPTRNVVVFDGANFSGKPYNYVTSSAEGATDSLVSNPIDLSGLTAKDSVYLSFYWRAKGLGERPDATDSLKLQFRDSLGRWQTVWVNGGGVLKRIVGKDTISEFQNNFVSQFQILNNKVFLSRAFQFRFISSGRLSGRFDNWFLDYIYLDKGRTSNNRTFRDVACRLPVNSFLKRYSAMPLKQYLVKPSAETADSLSTDVRNLSNIFNSTNFRFTLKDELSGRIFQNDPHDNSQIIQALSSQSKKNKVNALPPDFRPKTAVLSAKFDIITTDNNPPVSIPTIDLRRNDSISGKTVLGNYYAYDDGTAEYAVYMNKSLGKTAVRFVLNKTDTLSGVQMNITPILKDISGQSFTILVWSDKDKSPDKILAQKSFKVQYPADRDGFITYNFDNGVVLTDSVFYVGWLQIGQDPIAVGLDRNSPHENQIFINLGAGWDPYTNYKTDPNLAYFNGSLMVRAVMDGKTKEQITSVNVSKTDDWRVYPNPTNNIVQWEADIKHIEIYNPSGAKISEYDNLKQKWIDLSELPTGIYFLRLSNDEKTLIQKVLKN
jgi:Secretion system C-terminal sorting domain